MGGRSRPCQKPYFKELACGRLSRLSDRPHRSKIDHYNRLKIKRSTCFNNQKKQGESVSQEENLYQTPESNIETMPGDEYDTSPLFSPRGRIGRLHYVGVSFVTAMVSSLILSLLTAGLLALMGVSNENVDPDEIETFTTSISFVTSMLLFIPLYILVIKRLHDLNASGWWALAGIIPLLNLIMFFFLALYPGTKGPNQYGGIPNHGSRGALSLIVVFIFVLFVGIIAAIALPAYQDYIETAKEQQQIDQQQIEQQEMQQQELQQE